MDNIAQKLCLSNKKQDQAGGNDGEKDRAFSIMLAGQTRDYYFDRLRKKVSSFVQITAAMKRRSIMPGLERPLVREWDNMTLKETMTINVGKLQKLRFELILTKKQLYSKTIL